MKPPEQILNYAKNIVEGNGRPFIFNDEDILEQRRKEALEAIREYKEFKQRILRAKQERELIGAWLDAVQECDATMSTGEEKAK